PSLEGHAALTYDAMQTVRAAVGHLRLGNAFIPITPGNVWRELSSIRSSTPSAGHPGPHNDDVQGVPRLIDYGVTGGNLHYPANKQISILHVVKGVVDPKLSFYCGDARSAKNGAGCPFDQG